MGMKPRVRHDHAHHGHGEEDKPGHGPWDDETARWYIENHGEHPTNRMTVELAGLLPDDVVLDIGCGSGTALREAAAKLPRGRAVGVDPTPEMVRVAIAKTADHPARHRIQFHTAAASQLPLPDASITVAWAINSLHHWGDVDGGLAEARRVLRPGGRLLIADEETEPGRCGHADGELSDPRFVARALEAAGFDRVAVGRHAEGDASLWLVSGRRAG